MYYKSFKNEKQMKITEDMILSKLNKYNEIECKDHIILPIGNNYHIKLW